MRLAECTPLFILEMANNHMGSVDHGLRVIDEFRQAVVGFPYRFGFKLQYRHLDTFIHPDYQGSADYPYVKRFEETRLRADQFLRLRAAIGEAGFIAVCTPFDEPSVDLIEEHDYDIVKIASCSFTDWPLLERVALTDRPIIASCAGASLPEIDAVVSFFEHRGKDLALLHCVAQYPVRPANLELNQIDLLKNRYSGVVVGFSTHEDPEDAQIVSMAVAKGATIFEKHVGVPTEDIKLNAYSATPQQVQAWLSAAEQAYAMCGETGGRHQPSGGELASLKGLRRGVFASRDLRPGEILRPADCILAIPLQDGQVTANDLSKYTQLTVTQPIAAGDPVLASLVDQLDHREEIWEIIQDVKRLLQESGLALPSKVDLEISHHYGLDRFREHGLTMLSIVNREYCKKLLILLPGQGHPAQYHQQKEETFHVLYGDVVVELVGEGQQLVAGDVITIERGVVHAFSSLTGAVIEEISTTHWVDDSHYLDEAITANPDRKTFVTHWMT